MAAQVLFVIDAVEGVEANPQAVLVSVFDERAQAEVVFFRPFAGFVLATLFDDAPGIVPPATVVRGARGFEDFWRGHLVFFVRVCCSENEQFAAYGNFVVEDFLLRVGFAREHEDGPDVERLQA